jgi:hypothetical protein
MTILNRLGQEVEIDVNFRPRQSQGMHSAPAR